MELASAAVIEAGAAKPVILFHPSVAGARQWKALMTEMSDRYHLIADNMFGLGVAPPRAGNTPQGLAHQARLAEPFPTGEGAPVAHKGIPLTAPWP